MKTNYLYNENCLDTMAKMEDNFLDLTVTSPPYDNLRTYKGFDFDWKAVLKELYRTTKKGGVVVWVVGDATVKGSETGTSFRQALFAMELGFSLETMLYEKSQACFGSNTYYLQSFEYMFVLVKDATKPKTVNHIRDRENKRSGVESMSNGGLSVDGVKSARVKKEMQKMGKRKNIWKYGVGGGKTGHPAVFPEKLANDHIISWSNESDVVYDPFMGSGTTAKMAILNNRRYIGSEISEEYCGIIEDRLKAIQPKFI